MAAFRTSPAYDAHVEAGAKFREKNGWRRVDYFVTNESPELEGHRPSGAGSDSWSTATVAEHQAVREKVGLFDLTSFGKVEVWGPGAGQLLEWVCANRVGRGPGHLTYTQLLNAEGGVVGDVTVGQLGDDGYLVVTGTSAVPHDLDWLRTQLANPDAGIDKPVAILNQTSAWACYGIWGPLARDVLAPLVDISLTTDDFAYMQIREATIAGVPIRLGRVTFVGELGWEIYVPSEYGRWLWQRLSDEVQQHGGRRCGYRAIDSLRIEKGYLYLGADLTSDRTPYESGVGPFVRRQKDFLGRAALEYAQDPEVRLTAFVLEDPKRAVTGGELVQAPDGLGTKVTSGGFSYTFGQSVGLAYLRSELPPGTELTVDVGDEQVAARTISEVLYDPKGLRIRS